RSPRIPQIPVSAPTNLVQQTRRPASEPVAQPLLAVLLGFSESFLFHLPCPVGWNLSRPGRDANLLRFHTIRRLHASTLLLFYPSTLSLPTFPPKLKTETPPPSRPPLPPYPLRYLLPRSEHPHLHRIPINLHDLRDLFHRESLHFLQHQHRPVSLVQAIQPVVHFLPRLQPVAYVRRVFPLLFRRLVRMR